jgi:hypothetical protein
MEFSTLYALLLSGFSFSLKRMAPGDQLTMIKEFAELESKRSHGDNSEATTERRVLEWISYLDVDSVPVERVNAVAAYWMAQFETGLKSISDEMDLLETTFLFRIASVAARLSERTRLKFVDFFDGKLAADGPARKPENLQFSAEFVAIPGYSQVASYFELFDDLAWPLPRAIARQFFLFLSPKHDVSPEFDSYESVAHFCLIRYLWESITGKRANRINEEPISFGNETPFAAFATNPLVSVPYDPSLNHQILFLALLNFGIAKRPLPDSLPQTPDTHLVSRFLLRMPPLSPLETLIFNSSEGVPDASIALLSCPECSPLLQSDFLDHRLLRIFFQPREELVLDEPSWPLTLEGTAELFWHVTIPADLSVPLFSFISDALWSLPGAVCPVGSGSDQSLIMDSPPAFFSHDSRTSEAVLLNTILHKLIVQCPSVLDEIEADALTDLTMNPEVDPTIKAQITRISDRRLVFWATISHAFVPFATLFIAETRDFLVGFYRALLSVGATRTLDRWAHRARTEWYSFATGHLILDTLVLSTQVLSSKIYEALARDPSNLAPTAIWSLMSHDRGGYAVKLLDALKLDLGMAVAIL